MSSAVSSLLATLFSCSRLLFQVEKEQCRFGLLPTLFKLRKAKNLSRQNGDWSGCHSLQSHWKSQSSQHESGQVQWIPLGQFECYPDFRDFASYSWQFHWDSGQIQHGFWIRQVPGFIFDSWRKNCWWICQVRKWVHFSTLNLITKCINSFLGSRISAFKSFWLNWKESFFLENKMFRKLSFFDIRGYANSAFFTLHCAREKDSHAVGCMSFFKLMQSCLSVF